jgi:hypothetical protein
VDNAALRKIKTYSPKMVLSPKSLKASAKEMLGAGPKGTPDGPEAIRQKQPITISMALASLTGLTYDISSLAKRTLVEASTYLDFFNLTLNKDVDADAYVEYSLAAIASGANAMGFPPELLDRSAEKAAYEATGLKRFPADGKFWYTDGGTVDNEPLGRTIELANIVNSDDDRVFLLIHPDPGAPSAHMDDVFGGDQKTPPWVRTATHVISMMRSQSVYSDLRNLEKTNSLLERVGAITPALSSGLEAGLAESGLPESERQRIRDRVDQALGQALAKIQSQKGKDPKAGWTTQRPAPSGGGYGDTAQALIEAATGLAGRDPVRVEIVSPALGAGPDESPSTLLAGAFLFHFGGFFDIDYRRSDFALGYRNMTYWLKNCLGSYLPGINLQNAFVAVDKQYKELGWDGIRKGGATLGSLSFGRKVELGLLAGHAGIVVDHDVLTGGT